jgi:hypothetical protein
MVVIDPRAEKIFAMYRQEAMLQFRAFAAEHPDLAKDAIVCIVRETEDQTRYIVGERATICNAAPGLIRMFPEGLARAAKMQGDSADNAVWVVLLDQTIRKQWLARVEFWNFTGAGGQA